MSMDGHGGLSRWMVGLVEQGVQHEHVGGLHMLLAVGHVRRVGEVGVAVGFGVEG